jgi:MFS superfamily sulfate permease-like transporter
MALLTEAMAVLIVLAAAVLLVVVVLGRITGNGGTETDRGTAAGAAACGEAGEGW